MTDKDLGTAAGDIFAKAFTLGYETGRKYVPAGGMALTAEQVEDVRIVTTEVGGYTGEQFRRWHAAKDRLVDALFPVTEPAEDSVGDPLQAWKEFLKPKPIGWYSTMTREFATEHFGFPEVTGLLECTHTASDGGTWGWCGGDWELLVYPPAPAEPAEEGAKAEAQQLRDLSTALRAALGILDPLEGGGWAHAWQTVDDLDDCANRISSPVVPAPTETEWQTWQEVPEGVKYYGVGDTYLDEPVVYVNRPSVVRHRVDDGKRSSTPDYEVESFAPFVAAEEG